MDRGVRAQVQRPTHQASFWLAPVASGNRRTGADLDHLDTERFEQAAQLARGQLGTDSDLGKDFALLFLDRTRADPQTQA